MLARIRQWIASIEAPAVSSDAVDFEFIAESSNDVVIMCDEAGIASYVSPSSLDLLGVGPEEIIGKTHLAYILPADLPLIDAARAGHKAGRARARVTFRMMRKNEEIIWVEGSGRAVRDPKTGRAHHVVVLRDITERKALEEQLSALAATDGLTGLANRRAFDKAFESEWGRTRRTKTKLSLLMIDVDNFKSFNDRYGHQAGDDCLRAISATVNGALLRGGDFSARYGGEEIAVILPDASPDGAAAVAEKIRSAVETLRIPHARNDGGLDHVTVSVGAATALSSAGGTPQMPAGLLQAADRALYQAKHEGRNRVKTAPVITADTFMNRPERTPTLLSGQIIPKLLRK